MDKHRRALWVYHSPAGSTFAHRAVSLASSSLAGARAEGEGTCNETGRTLARSWPHSGATPALVPTRQALHQDGPRPLLLADAPTVISGTRLPLAFDSRPCAAAEQPPPAASHLPLSPHLAPSPQSRNLHVTDAPFAAAVCARNASRSRAGSTLDGPGRESSVIWPCPSIRISRGSPSRVRACVRVSISLSTTAAGGRNVSPRSGPKISSSVCQPALARHPPNPVKSSAAAAPPPLDLYRICAPSLQTAKVRLEPLRYPSSLRCRPSRASLHRVGFLHSQIPELSYPASSSSIATGEPE